MSANPRWKRRPEGSTWGDYGPDDELGRVNELTPERVLAAVREVHDGKTFCLSLPLDIPGGNLLNPRRTPPEVTPTGRAEAPRFVFPLARENAVFTDVTCDDKVAMCLQYSTQWDSFAHFGCMFDANDDGEEEAVFYNGYRAGEHVVGPIDYLHGDAHNHGPFGAHRLSVANYATKGMQGRGVMVDLRAHFGDERRWIGYDDLMRVMDADKVSVEAGDMLCLHTGFADRLLDWGGNPDPKLVHAICAVLDGRDKRLQAWIADSRIAALIGDNYAVEGWPALPGTGERYAALPLHELCLVKLGLPIGEIWHLSELARHLRSEGRSRFLLTAPPLRLPRAVGSPASPIATT